MFGKDFLSRHMTEGGPLDRALNAAIMTMANRTNPMGWHVEPCYSKAPSDLTGLNVSVNLTGRIVVWGGACENTIFGDAEHNQAFRAWHDSVHYLNQLPMTLAGEAAAAYVQAWQLLQNYGFDNDIIEWVAVLLTEIIGQCQYRLLTGQFPRDQGQWTLDNIDTWRNLAKRISIELADDDATCEDALKLAREGWGQA